MDPTQEELLSSAARDGVLDASHWPRVLEDVLKRLQKIVSSEFPLPTVSAPSTTISDSLQPSDSTAREDSQLSTEADTLSQQTSGTDKENTSPMMPPPAPPSRNTASRRTLSNTGGDPLSSYPDLAASYQSSVQILKESFAKSPPYTVQRLAELVLYPRKHYCYLPPYLSALDRVVSVSSPTTSFPLPHQTVPNGILQTNGEHDQPSNMSGDEGLGGALLTPIPWLRHSQQNEDGSNLVDGELHTEDTETIDGPNGAGRIETVSVTVNGIHSSSHGRGFANGHHETANGSMTTEQELREQGAVTQGELLRQEQEAGVIPVTQVAGRRGLSGGHSGTLGSDTAATTDDTEMTDELPHARGPEEIGMEDLGPQGGAIGAGRPLDLEAALGRGRSISPEPTREVVDETPAQVDGDKVEHQPVAEEVEQL